MANKYIKLSSGNLAEEEALVISAGAGDTGKIPALDATGRLDNSVMPAGIGAETKEIVASEDLSAGNFVNVYNDTGTTKCRKADAATNKRADGFVLAAVTATENATVYFEGTNNQLSALTGGTPMFLSGTTPGAATATPPSTSTYIVQEIGKAISATEITFEPSKPVTLA
jgi:hypothetical protein